jgi:hypothetical protein
MKPSFLRMRRRWRAVLVVPSHLAELGASLKRKNYHIIVLPDVPLDQEQKDCWLPGRTLVTDQPEELKYDVPVLEFSVIDISGVETNDAAAIADMISRAWTKLRLKTEGWFVLTLRQDGEHQIEFPE